MSFLFKFTCLPIMHRQNTHVFFQLINISKLYFSCSFFPFIIDLLSHFHLRIYFVILLYYDCFLGYIGLGTLILSFNFLSAFFDILIINKKLA